jgi:hypothetical protein
VLPQYTQPGSPGAILLLYSAMLSRGLADIPRDMDELNTRLIGAHYYCTQELVNLLLTGKATSNVHDGLKVLGSGKDAMQLQGLEARNQIGLLSLFEHYDSCQVGKFLKCPRMPIWLLYAESHYTVLFSKSYTLAESERMSTSFDVFYYDQLAGMEALYTLTIGERRGAFGG